MAVITSSNKYCVECGKGVERSWKFCAQCGTAVPADDPETVYYNIACNWHRNGKYNLTYGGHITSLEELKSICNFEEIGKNSRAEKYVISYCMADQSDKRSVLKTKSMRKIQADGFLSEDKGAVELEITCLE